MNEGNTFQEVIFENQVLTSVEAAEFLKCSTKKLYRLIETHGLPCKRIGNEYRFLVSDLVGWMKGGHSAQKS